MYLAICNVTASVTAVHRDPFFSYGTQWLNDSANVGCFIAGICRLPHSCASHSEQQVSYCDACFCLRCWNKCVGLLPLNKPCSGPWFVRGLTPQNQATNETVPFREQTLLAACSCVCFLVESQCGGRARSPLWTMGAHGEWQRSKLKGKSILSF